MKLYEYLPVIIISFMLCLMAEGLVFTFRYFRSLKRSQTLKFTQEAARSVSKEIEEFYSRYECDERWTNAVDRNIMDEILTETINPKDIDKRIPRIRVDCLSVLALCNELAVGINEGLYDEKYIRLVLGYKMLDFYKKYYVTLFHKTGEWDRLNQFMALELLLSKWTSDNFVADSIDKHRKYR